MSATLDPIAERLDEIRQRAEHATKGPWQYDAALDEVLSPAAEPHCGGSYWVVLSECRGNTNHAPLVSGKRDLADFKFIAESRQDIPWLLELISDLQDENRAWREADRIAKEDLAGEQFFQVDLSRFQKHGGEDERDPISDPQPGDYVQHVDGEYMYVIGRSGEVVNVDLLHVNGGVNGTTIGNLMTLSTFIKNSVKP